MIASRLPSPHRATDTRVPWGAGVGAVGRHDLSLQPRRGQRQAKRSGVGVWVAAASMVAAVSFVAPVDAGNLRVATQNMRLAMELCLRNYRSVAQLPSAFAAAGYTIGAGLDPGTHEFSAPGVFGGFQDGYCFIQSVDVPLAIAEDMGQRLAQGLFPGKVELGGPETPVGAPIAQCEGLSIFAPQSLIRVSYAAAGNSGDCVNDGTSAIVINM